MSVEDLKQLSIKGMEGKDKNGIQSLLDANQLVYSLPMVNSLVQRRNLQTYNFSSSSYDSSSGQMSCTLQPGEGFINFQNSYMTFDIKCSANQSETWGFGSGSGLNIMETVTVNTRTGTQLSRSDKHNVLQIQEHKIHKSPNWFASVGQLMGYGAVGRAKDQDFQVIIPLNHISPVFSSPMLCPDAICSGMQIIISLERVSNAIVWSGVVTGHSYTISNPRVVADVHVLQPSAYRSLQMTAVRNGLEWVFADYHHESTPVITSLNVNVTKSVARALELIAVPRLDAAINVTNSDSLKSANVLYTEFQVQLGSHTFPQQKLKNNTETYANALYSADQFQDLDNRGAFLTETQYSSGGFAHLRQQLCSQSLLSFSGVSANNSRSIRLNSATSTVGNKTLDVFVKYMKVARAFKTNVAVSS